MRGFCAFGSSPICPVAHGYHDERVTALAQSARVQSMNAAMGNQVPTVELLESRWHTDFESGHDRVPVPQRLAVQYRDFQYVGNTGLFVGLRLQIASLTANDRTLSGPGCRTRDSEDVCQDLPRMIV